MKGLYKIIWSLIALSPFFTKAQGSYYIDEVSIDIVSDTTSVSLNKKYNSISLRTNEASFWGIQVDLGTESFSASTDPHVELDSSIQSHLMVSSRDFTEIRIVTKKRGSLRAITQYVSPLNLSLNGNNRRSNCKHPEMVSQQTWRQGLPAPVKGRVKTETKHCIIHHSGGGNGNNDYTALVRSYYIHHTQTNGWDDIGYNYLVAYDGTLYAGRDPEVAGIDQDNVQGAHYCGKNGGTMGVCLIGEFTTTQPSFAAINTLTDLLTWKLDKEGFVTSDSFPHPKSTDPLLSVIDGHRTGCNTECPGNLMFGHIEQVRQDVYNKLDQCSSVGIIDFEKDCKVFPNPASDFFTIKFKTHSSGSIQLVNSVGQKIINKNFLNLFGFTVSTKNIPKGTYYLKVQTKSETYTHIITIIND